MSARWLSAVVITAGFMLAEYVPGRASALHVDTLGPLLATAWLSWRVRDWWRTHPDAVHSLPARTRGALLGVSLFLLLAGGFRLLWVDPWLILPVLVPLYEIARSLGHPGKTRRDRPARLGAR